MFQRDLTLKTVNSEQEWTPRHIDVVAALYICTLILTAILNTKLFAFGNFVFAAGTLIYPMNTIFGDILTEVYGFNRTRRLIWVGLICDLMLVLFTQIAIILPPAPGYHLQEAYTAVYSNIPRIVVASFSAYLFCEFTNSFVMSRLKVWSNANNLPLRAVASTIAAQTIDSLIFFVGAFAGVVPNTVLVKMIWSGILFKVVYEILFLPLTMIFVRKLKSLEGIEHFDNDHISVLKF